MSTTQASATAYPFPTQIQTQTQSTRSVPEAALNESTDGEPNGPPSALAEAIDDFLGDLERKFKTVSDEILSKLDEMAERCDRIEAELLMRDVAGAGTSKSSIEEKSES